MDATNANISNPGVDPGVNRREVLRTGAAAGVGLTVLGALTGLGGCQSEKAQGKKKLITTGVVGIGQARDYPAGTVSDKFMETYGIYIANDAGTVVAIDPTCTHRGCPVKWTPEVHQFVCPCHGAQFDILGRVTKGPATKNLAAVTARSNPDGTLSVDLDKLHRPG